MNGRDRGSVTTWVMVLPLLLVVLGGISVDLWAGLSVRGRIAAIADEAAAAGASALSVGAVRADDQAVALDPAEAESRSLLAVDTHPEVALVTARRAVATAELVSVTVEGRFDLLLLRVVGGTSVPVSVTGHARPRAGG